MRNVADVESETTMLGHKMSFPVYISAAAKGGLAHPDAEEALCRAAFAKSTIQMCPHMATKTLEQMAAARARTSLLFLVNFSSILCTEITPLKTIYICYQCVHVVVAQCTLLCCVTPCILLFVSYFSSKQMCRTRLKIDKNDAELYEPILTEHWCYSGPGAVPTALRGEGPCRLQGHR